MFPFKKTQMLQEKAIYTKPFPLGCDAATEAGSQTYDSFPTWVFHVQAETNENKTSKRFSTDMILLCIYICGYNVLMIIATMFSS